LLKTHQIIQDLSTTALILNTTHKSTVKMSFRASKVQSRIMDPELPPNVSTVLSSLMPSLFSPSVRGSISPHTISAGSRAYSPTMHLRSCQEGWRESFASIEEGSQKGDSKVEEGLLAEQQDPEGGLQAGKMQVRNITKAALEIVTLLVLGAALLALVVWCSSSMPKMMESPQSV
jgi:hypothetical protein